MYKQTLYTVHNDHLADKKVKQTNKHKNFKYGYNEDLDCVIISKDGTLGNIYNIQGLKVGLPKTPDKIDGEDVSKNIEIAGSFRNVQSRVFAIVLVKVLFERIYCVSYVFHQFID